MSATQLLTDLRITGLHVVEEPKWKTRGFNWAVGGKPEGVMQHHTAPPNPYPIKRLYGPLFYWIKANAATHEDGTVFLIAYKACNYSSGRGSSKVLTENVRRKIAPIHNALVRGIKGGNKHFWNQEHSHPGDGSLLPQIQLDAIVVLTQVVDDHFGLVSEQGISHAEWTRRKTDPLWNGSNRTAITQIRRLVDQQQGGEMQYADIYKKWTPDDIDEMKAKGLFSEGTADYWKNDVGIWSRDWDHFTAVVLAADTALLPPSGGLSEGQVKQLIADTTLTP